MLCENFEKTHKKLIYPDFITRKIVLLQVKVSNINQQNENKNR